MTQTCVRQLDLGATKHTPMVRYPLVLLNPTINTTFSCGKFEKLIVVQQLVPGTKIGSFTLCEKVDLKNVFFKLSMRGALLMNKCHQRSTTSAPRKPTGIRNLIHLGFKHANKHARISLDKSKNMTKRN